MDDTDDRYNYLTRVHNMVVNSFAEQKARTEGKGSGDLYDNLMDDIDDLARAYANYRTGNVVKDGEVESGASSAEPADLKAEFEKRSKALAESMGGDHAAKEAVKFVQEFVDDQISAVRPGREK